MGRDGDDHELGEGEHGRGGRAHVEFLAVVFLLFFLFGARSRVRLAVVLVVLLSVRGDVGRRVAAIWTRPISQGRNQKA